ncbi:MAG: LysR substrate-binding domain-containing protein [Parvularculaceae bacterium]
MLRPVALLRESAALAPQPAGVSNNLEEVRRMVIAGLGIAPLPIHVVERDVRDGLLWRLPPYESPPAIDLFVVTNPATAAQPRRTGIPGRFSLGAIEERRSPSVLISLCNARTAKRAGPSSRDPRTDQPSCHEQQCLHPPASSTGLPSLPASSIKRAFAARSSTARKASI